MANKRLAKDKFRIIKISKDALLEFIYESVIDRQKDFFDIGEIEVTSRHYVNETLDYLCLVSYDRFDENHRYIFPKEIDFDKLLKNMEDTTHSLFGDGKRYVRYKDFSIEELKKIQDEDSY